MEKLVKHQILTSQDVLKHLKHKRKFMQNKDLAIAMGVSDSEMSQVLHGKRRVDERILCALGLETVYRKRR